MFTGEFKAFTAQRWSDYVANSPKPAELFLINAIAPILGYDKASKGE